jgi:acyl-lipid omega-6 desaturase (Delta-12 desaturase)
VSSIDRIKQQKRTLIAEYAKPENIKGFIQIGTALGPIAVLWYVAAASVGISYWVTAGVTLLLSLFLLRVFVLMHECGHGSMFRSGWLNKTFGFLFGVVSGMPQYVWSQHHHYHHATNGNWAKYRGPLNVLTVDEYAALTDKQQRGYRRARSVWIAPIAGFMYLIFNPRVTWLKGNVSLVSYVLRKKIAQPGTSLATYAAEYKTPYWANAREYWHMAGNNVAVLSAWVLMSLALGPMLFFTVYVVSVSLAGGAGIVLFTVQHNFEHSYASGNAGWDHDAAAIHGTSFLTLPRWLNWITANIAYHHVHHLSPRIPNYCLVECHAAYSDLFRDVTRVTLRQIAPALKFVLWDVHARRIISIAEYQKGRIEASALEDRAA